MRTSMAAATTQLLQLANFWCIHVVHFPHTAARIRCAASCSHALHFSFKQNSCQDFASFPLEKLPAFVGVRRGVQGLPSLLSPL